MIIYKITNLVNGKVYIGKTMKNQLRTRFREHIAEARRGNKSYLKQALRKYGFDKFSIEPICEVADRDELSKKEIELIKLYDSMNPEKGYNLTPGGEGAAYWTGKKRSPESSVKRVATWRNNGHTTAHLHTPESTAKGHASRLANGNYRKSGVYKNTPESIEKMRLAALNRDRTPYLGRKDSEATNLKRSQSLSKTLAEKHQVKRDQAKSLYTSGLSLSAIAEQLSMSTNFVYVHTRDLRIV